MSRHAKWGRLSAGAPSGPELQPRCFGHRKRLKSPAEAGLQPEACPTNNRQDLRRTTLDGVAADAGEQLGGAGQGLLLGFVAAGGG